MKRLSSEHIKLLHRVLMEETGALDGMRDENLFESAINSPFQTFDGVLYILRWSVKPQDWGSHS